MIPEIFDINNGHIVINHNCLLVPELKAVHDLYRDPIPALSFLNYLFDPKGPYCNVPEEDKEEILLGDFPGEYTLEDPEMIAAITKLRTLTMSPTYRFYLDNKKLIEKLGAFAEKAPITTGREGNINAMLSMIKNVGKTISEFKQLEKEVQKELDEHKSRVRGERKKAYDQ